MLTSTNGVKSVNSTQQHCTFLSFFFSCASLRSLFMGSETAAFNFVGRKDLWKLWSQLNIVRKQIHRWVNLQNAHEGRLKHAALPFTYGGINTKQTALHEDSSYKAFIELIQRIYTSFKGTSCIFPTLMMNWNNSK